MSDILSLSIKSDIISCMNSCCNIHEFVLGSCLVYESCEAGMGEHTVRSVEHHTLNPQTRSLAPYEFDMRLIS